MSEIDNIVNRYKGKPYNKRHVPAKPYRTFDDEFSLYMEEIQQQVDEMRAKRAPYQAVMDALKETESDYPQIFKVECSSDLIEVKTDLLSSQHWSVFNRLVSTIQSNLINRGISGYQHAAEPRKCSEIYWRIPVNDKLKIIVSLNVPPTGNIYRTEVRVQREIPARAASSYIDTEYYWDGEE